VGRSERDWEVLDTCLNADDMRLVASAYSFLKEREFLPNFGKFCNIGNMFVCFFVFWSSLRNLIEFLVCNAKLIVESLIFE